MVVPATPEAYELMMLGSQALTDVEENGIKVDVDYVNKAIVASGARIRHLEAKLKDSDVFRVWRKRFGSSADLGKREQLSAVFFKELGYEPKKRTATDKFATDAAAFEHVDHDFIPLWTENESLKRCLVSDLIGTLKQVDSDQFLHAFFDLYLAITYRSSSSDPNFQNYPVRNPMLAKLVRRMFTPRSAEYMMVEADYGALEFRGAACFWKDPKMVAYASDPTLDIHRDMAAECYLLEPSEVNKMARTFGKNKFVFPILYGSWWKNIGTSLWEEIDRSQLTHGDGTPLKEHLRSKNIHSLDAYLEHIQKVEKRFNDRFSHWSKAKDAWWDAYQRTGEFQLMTGFVCRGIYSYNFLMNSPIQGPSFHLLLWSLTTMNAWLKDNNKKSMIIGQIHDSILMDIHLSERDEVISKLVAIMTVDAKKRFPWVITPLEAEVEATVTTWLDKREITQTTSGEWKSKDGLLGNLSL